jgi:hypothetical protein
MFFINNYPLLIKIFFILIRYIILPIQAIFLFHIFNKDNKKNIILTTISLVILRIILQYTVEPIIQINKITYFIFKENISEYQPVISYIITLTIIGSFYNIIRKPIDYLYKK